MSLKMVCVTSESPFPPNHGARVDVWNRYTLLRRAGCEIMLVTWAREPPSSADLAALSEVFSRVEVRPIGRSWRDLARRLWYLPVYSPHVSSRLVAAREMRAIAARAAAFGAELVLAEEPYGAVLAMTLAGRLELPLFYRSHNVEFRYMRSQAQAATGMRRQLALRLASLHLEGLELALQQAARVVFDCSSSDAAYWKSRGIGHTMWLPNLFADQPRQRRDWASRPYDIVFLGNLNTPNNVAGLTWFIGEVLPLLRRLRPGLRVCIAGSHPSNEVGGLLAGQPDVALVRNPDKAEEIWSSGRVLINPVLTGSGSNVKSAEMLFYDSPLVTTPSGVREFPAWMREEFGIGESAAAFAELIAQALGRQGFELTALRLRLRTFFGPEGITTMLDALHGGLGGAGRV